MDKDEYTELFAGSIKELGASVGGIEKIQESQRSIEEKIDALLSNQNNFSTKLDQIEGKVNEIERKVDETQTEMVNVKREASDMKDEMEDLKVRLTEAEKAASQTAIIESKLDEMQQEMEKKI